MLTPDYYITLQDFNVHGANRTHGTESEALEDYAVARAGPQHGSSPRAEWGGKL
jgi:hypothetical protein